MSEHRTAPGFREWASARAGGLADAPSNLCAARLGRYVGDDSVGGVQLTTRLGGIIVEDTTFHDCEVRCTRLLLVGAAQLSCAVERDRVPTPAPGNLAILSPPAEG